MSCNRVSRRISESSEDMDTWERNRHDVSWDSDTWQPVIITECPECDGPVQHCCLGHIICSACDGQVTHCPICCNEVQDSSSTEEDNSLYPCTNKDYGCEEEMIRSNRLQHERYECVYKQYRCPYRFRYMCSDFAGSAEDLAKHLLTDHKKETEASPPSCTECMDPSYDADISKFSVLNGKSLWMTTAVQEIDGKHFVLCLYHFHSPYHRAHFAIIKMIGTVAEARQYVCKVSIMGQKGALSYIGEVKSMHEDEMETYNNRECLTYDCAIATDSLESSAGYGFDVWRR